MRSEDYEKMRARIADAERRLAVARACLERLASPDSCAGHASELARDALAAIAATESRED